MANLFQLAAAKVLQDYNRNRSIAAAAADRLAADSADRDLVTPFRGGGGSPMPAATPAAPAQQQKKKSIWATDPADVPEPAVTPAASASRADILEAALDRLRGRTRATQATGITPAGVTFTSPQGLQAIPLDLESDWTDEQKQTAADQARQEVQTRYGDGSRLSLVDMPRYQAALDRIPQRTNEILESMEKPASPLSADATWQRAGDAVKKFNEQHTANQRRYADLMEANRTGSMDGMTPEQKLEAERETDAQLNWSDLVASYNGNEDLALDYYGKELDRNLQRIAARDREKEIETLTASDPQAAEVYDFMHRPERLSSVFNPFTARSELEADLATAQGYQPAGAGDREVNGALAQRTAAGIRARMAYQDDPEKAMADVQADLDRLRKIKQDGTYNADQVQELIWQQERQLKLLEGYAAARGDKDGSLAAKGREQYLAGLNAEQKAYADRTGITGGTGVAQMSAKGQTANLLYNSVMSMAGRQQKGGAELSNLAMMTEQERNGYFALYATDKAAAKTYLDGMQRELATRSMQIQETARGQIAEAAPVAWGAAEELEGLATEPIKPVASAIVAGQHLAGQEIQRGGWAEYVATQGDKNAERLKGTIATAMEAKGYTPEQIAMAQAVYGVLHNTAANVTRGTISTAMGIPSALSTALMAAGTLAPTYYNLTDSTAGTSQGQRMITAAGDAVSEFLTEALSDAHMFEAFKNGFRAGDSWWQTATNAAWQIMAGGIVESSTEVINDVASQEWHKIMLGQESEANRRLDAYYRMALAGEYANSPERAMEWAQKQAFRDTMSGYLETAWTSFASGGLMDIGGRVVNGIRTREIRRPVDITGMQEKGTGNYQLTGPTGNSVEAGSFNTVDEALEALQNGYYDANSLSYSTQAEAVQAAEDPAGIREPARIATGATIREANRRAETALRYTQEGAQDLGEASRPERAQDDGTGDTGMSYTQENENPETRGAAEEIVDARSAAEADRRETEPAPEPQDGRERVYDTPQTFTYYPPMDNNDWRNPNYHVPMTEQEAADRQFAIGEAQRQKKLADMSEGSRWVYADRQRAWITDEQARRLGIAQNYTYGEVDGQFGRFYREKNAPSPQNPNGSYGDTVFVPINIFPGKYGSREALMAVDGVRVFTPEEAEGYRYQGTKDDMYERYVLPHRAADAVTETINPPGWKEKQQQLPTPKPESGIREQERPAAEERNGNTDQAQPAQDTEDRRQPIRETAAEPEGAWLADDAEDAVRWEVSEPQAAEERQQAPDLPEQPAAQERPQEAAQTQGPEQAQAQPQLLGDPATPETRDVGGYRPEWTPEARTEAQGAPAAVRTESAGTTAAERISRTPIRRDEERVTVAEGTKNAQAVGNAADVIRDEDSQDGVARVLETLPTDKTPADNAEGRADIQAMGDAYEAALRGEDLPHFGGIYELTPARKALVAAAHDAGQADLTERMKEIARKNAAVAAGTGFRDGAQYTRHMNGVNLQGVTQDLTAGQKMQLGILDAMGRTFGIDFRIYDTLGNKNAVYRKDSGQVDISLAAEGGLVKAASHELYHYITAWNKDAAANIRNLVLDYLQRAPGYDLDTRVQEIAGTYINAGENNFDPLEEIVADSMLDMFADDAAKLSGAIYADMDHAQSIAQKAAEHIKKVSDFLKDQLNKITGKSPEIRALHDQSEYVAAVGDILRKSVLDATRTRQAQTYNAELINTDPHGIVAQYYNSLEEQYNEGQARRGMDSRILKLMLGRDGKPLRMGAEEGMQRLRAAYEDYTAGRKSMAKALEDQGMQAPDDDLIRVAVFAAREAQARTEAQGVQSGAYTPSIHYDDDFESMARAGNTYGGVDEDHEAHLILQKIFDIVKRGRTWQTDEESLRPGSWAEDLTRMVDDIKRTTGTKVSAEKITGELRAMYTALDEALMSGQDFNIGQAVTYARRIAEMIGEKAGQRIDLEDDALTDMMRGIRGKTITLTPAQADEARGKYGTIRALNQAYRGLVSFTIQKTKTGSMTLEDLQAEHELFFSRDLSEADLFNRFEDLDEEYKGQREGAVDYNGMTRTEFERDLALRIVGGYFDLDNGTVAQTAGRTQAKTPGEKKYVAAVRQLRTEYNRRTRELEAEYQRKTAEAVDMADEEIEEAKRGFEEAKRRIISSYEYQIEQTAAALGTPLSAETRMRLLAGMDLEEASMAYLDMRRRIESEIERRAQDRAERLAKAITRGEINGRAQEVVSKRVARWRDAEARNALRKSIEKTVTDFSAKLMHPTDKKHAPEEMRTAFAKVLNLVDTSNPGRPGGFRTQRWQGVQNWLAISGLLEQYSDDMSVMFDEDLVANITWLQEHAAGKSIMQMDVDELRTVSETLTSIKHTFDHYDEMLTAGQNERISEIAEPINVLANERHNEGKAHKRQDGWKQQLAKQLQGSWMDPIRWRNWADRMTGKLRFGSRVHGMLRDAQDKQIRGVQKAEELFGTWLAGVNRKQLEAMHGKRAETISVPHGDGEIRMTRGQAMSLYLLMQREQAVGHILGGEIKNEAGQVTGKFPGGGFTIGDADSKDGKVGTYKPIEATREEIEAILDQLTPAEKALADGTREIMDWCSKLGNEVSMAMYGYNKYMEKNYFPIKTDPHYTSQTLTADNSNPLYRLKNQGFSKELQVNANSPLLVRDIFDVVRDHAVGMVNYNAWVIPALDITRVLNYKLKDTFTPEGMPEGTKVSKTVSTTSQALEILMGENGQKYIDQLLKDINGIKKDDVEKQGNTAQTLLSRFKGGAVAYNLSTAMKQPWSITRAWATIGLNYFTPGRQKGCSGKVNDIMKKYSPIYVWKQYGNFVLELGKSMDQILYPQMEAGVKGWINDKSMALPGWADNVTWRNIWRAAEKKTAHDHPDLTPGTDAFYQAVALEFRECIDQTQVVDGIMQRTQYMRSPGGFAKMTTSFMGEPMKSFNLFTDAVAGVIQTEKGSEARKKAGQALARGAVVYGVSSMTMAVVSSFVSAFRHWDGDEPWAKTFMRYLMGFGDWEEFKESSDKEKIQGILGSNLVGEFSILNKLPILRDLLTIASGWDVERTDMSAIKDLVDSAFRLWQSIAGNGKTAWPKAARDFLGYVSTTFGMPIGNLMKEIGYLSNGFALGAQQITGYDTFEWQYFNMRMNLNMDYISNSSSYVRLMYRAEQFGNQAMSDHIRQDLINAGVKEKNIDAKLRKLYKEAAAGQVDEYAALLEAGKKDEAEKMRKEFGGGTDAWDDAVEEMIRKDIDVAEANLARKRGDLKPMQDLIARYRKLGYSDAAIWKGINKQYNETQDEDDQVSVTEGSMWLANDLNEAVFRGDMEDIKYIVKWMQNENNKKPSTIKSGVTKAAKVEYNRLIKAGDTLGAKRLKETLLGMGLGYTDKEIQGWIGK